MLGALVTAAVGAALYSFTRPTGVGNPDHPARVLLVTRGQTAGQSIVLRDAGFDAVEGTSAAWERKAAEDVPELGPTGTGAVVALADRLGYGYVVFEGPETVDFSGLDIAGDPPSFPDHVQYAVVSVGDLAFPHRVSVNPPPSPVLRDRSLILLQALFEQDQLAALLPDNAQPSVDELELRDQLSVALDRLERIPAAEKMARDVSADVERRLLEEERGDPRPIAVGELFENGHAYPLADGNILHITRAFSIVSNDGVRVDLDLQDVEHLWIKTPGSESRALCEAVAGGSLATAESARWEVAQNGSSILLRTLSDGLVLWTVDVAQDTACGLVRTGPVPAPLAGMVDRGLPYQRFVARSGTIDGLGLVTVVTAGEEGREMLGMLEGMEIVGVTWVDERRLVARARPRMPGPDRLVLLDRDRPLEVLTLEATAFDNAMRLGDVAVVPSDGGPFALVVSVETDGQWLYLLRGDRTLAALFDEPPVLDGAGADEVDGRPRVGQLDSNGLEIRPLTHAGRAHDPVVSPDGRWVAFSLSDTGRSDAGVDRPDATNDQEIAMVSLDSGTTGLRLLTRNTVTDGKPRFTRDGEHVVFGSRFELPRTNWSTTVARVTSVAQRP